MERDEDYWRDKEGKALRMWRLIKVALQLGVKKKGASDFYFEAPLIMCGLQKTTTSISSFLLGYTTNTKAVIAKVAALVHAATNEVQVPTVGSSGR